MRGLDGEDIAVDGHLIFLTHGDKMENVIKFDVPIKVEMKKGANWLEMSSFPADKEVNR